MDPMIESAVTAAIPARLESHRFPNKALADLNGHPMIWHVWDRVRRAERVSEVVVVTDSDEISRVVVGWGGKVLMTDTSPRSGTERIASVMGVLQGELILNVQVDEPLIEPLVIDQLIASWALDPTDVITPVFRITDRLILEDPNIVKVVCDERGDALDFSRTAIPNAKDGNETGRLDEHEFWGHVGVYGYSRRALAAYPNLKPTPLEVAQGLEQLCFLGHGYRIRTMKTAYRPISVNCPADLELVRQRLWVEGSQRVAAKHGG